MVDAQKPMQSVAVNPKLIQGKPRNSQGPGSNVRMNQTRSCLDETATEDPIN